MALRCDVLSQYVAAKLCIQYTSFVQMIAPLKFHLNLYGEKMKVFWCLFGLFFLALHMLI